MKRRQSTPSLPELLQEETGNLYLIMEAASSEALRMDRYLSWNELRHRLPPSGLSSRQWWLGIKLHRSQARQELPLHTAKGSTLNFASTPYIQQHLHKVDRAAGAILMTDADALFNVKERDKYLLTSIAEEAIMSSMLEGAVVTRSEAKELIRSNRTPKDEHEQMVMNNYRTMQMILQHKDRPLSPDFILSLHRSMVEGTLKSPDKAGTFRTAEDKVYIEDVRSGDIIHVPPAADTLPSRLEALCRFANGENGNEQYIHPVVRAIILHFQLAFDHPFVDGNGRTARALFYWAMLKAGYWLFEYISISREIYRHPRGYYESFLNTEEDSNDLNYFIINQLQTILQSIDALMSHVRDKQKLQDKLHQSLESSFASLNHRQRQVLQFFLQHPNSYTSVSLHCKQHGIVRQTARTDLNDLVELGFLTSQSISREFIYKPLPNLEEKISLSANSSANIG